MKLLAADCEFDAFLDQALRDIFAIGIEYSSKPSCPQFFYYVVRLTNNRKNITEVMKFRWPNLSSSSSFFFFQ